MIKSTITSINTGTIGHGAGYDSSIGGGAAPMGGRTTIEWSKMIFDLRRSISWWRMELRIGRNRRRSCAWWGRRLLDYRNRCTLTTTPQYLDSYPSQRNGGSQWNDDPWNNNQQGHYSNALNPRTHHALEARMFHTTNRTTIPYPFVGYNGIGSGARPYNSASLSSSLAAVAAPLVLFVFRR